MSKKWKAAVDRLKQWASNHTEATVLLITLPVLAVVGAIVTLLVAPYNRLRGWRQRRK